MQRPFKDHLSIIFFLLSGQNHLFVLKFILHVTCISNLTSVHAYLARHSPWWTKSLLRFAKSKKKSWRKFLRNVMNCFDWRAVCKSCIFIYAILSRSNSIGKYLIFGSVATRCVIPSLILVIMPSIHQHVLTASLTKPR